jgi:hypothetical protein
VLTATQPAAVNQDDQHVPYRVVDARPLNTFQDRINALHAQGYRLVMVIPGDGVTDAQVIMEFQIEELFSLTKQGKEADEFYVFGEDGRGV